MAGNDASAEDSDPGHAPAPTRHRYDDAFRAMDRGGRVLTECYLKAYGQDALQGADPYSAIASSELRWLIHGAGLDARQTLVDLGCGRGGPGIAVAQWSGVRLIGIDWSVVGVKAAAERASRAGINPPPSFLACDARAMPFADRTVDAFISIDVLQLIPDREKVFEEVARILRPGGVLAFSSWERTDDEDGPPRLLRQPRDYVAYVNAVNMRMEAIDVPREAPERDAAFWTNVRASASDLRKEVGEDVAGRILGEASLEEVFGARTRRVLCIARA